MGVVAIKGEAFDVCLYVVKVREGGENDTTIVMGVGEWRYNRVSDGRNWVLGGVGGDSIFEFVAF